MTFSPQTHSVPIQTVADSQARLKTITEGELFRQFLETDIAEFNRKGEVRWRTPVRELFSHLGLLEADGLFEQIEDYVVGGDSESTLGQCIEEVEEILLGLKEAARQFHHLKREQLAEDDGPEAIDDDSEEADRFLPMAD